MKTGEWCCFLHKICVLCNYYISAFYDYYKLISTFYLVFTLHYYVNIVEILCNDYNVFLTLT
jgi:hypothetical protein